MTSPSPDKNKNTSLLQYAGMGTQFLIGIGIGVFIGLKCDQWLALKIPLFIWILPLIIITGFIIKLVKGTAKRK